MIRSSYKLNVYLWCLVHLVGEPLFVVEVRTQSASQLFPMVRLILFYSSLTFLQVDNYIFMAKNPCVCKSLPISLSRWPWISSVITSRSQTELEVAWKKVLLNQFHDVLPGTSIPMVYPEAEALYQEAISAALKVRDSAAAAIFGQKNGVWTFFFFFHL